MIRSYDGDGIDAYMRETPSLSGFLNDMHEWVNNDNNVALEEDGSFGLFTYELPSVYAAHYFFRARGKAAFDLAVRMLRTIFDEYDARVIIGLTPVENKPAIWMTLRIGFTKGGVVTIDGKDYQLFTLGRDAFKEIH